jgi:hypothetical protein
MAEDTLVAESPSEPIPARLSQLQRVLDTFVAPSATFHDILRNSSWWLPCLLMVLTTLGVTVAIDRQVGFEQVVETQNHLNPAQQEQLSAMQPEDRAIQMQRMVTGYRYVSYAAPLLILAIAAFASLILWASFNLGLGARATYAQIFCLWMFANLPRMLAALVTIVTLCFGNSPETFDLKQPAGTNIGYYLPDVSPWLRTLLGSFDLVSFWVLGLLIFGGAIVARVKIGQAAAVVIGWWLLIVLVGTAATAAFS